MPVVVQKFREQKAWLDALKFYAHDLYELFDDHKFFTQNYWFFINEIVARTIAERPLTKGEAYALFRVPGSKQAKGLYDRSLKRRMIYELPNGDDARSTLVLADPDFMAKYVNHLERTRLRVVQTICESSGP